MGLVLVTAEVMMHAALCDASCTPLLAWEAANTGGSTLVLLKHAREAD